ncbi:MAG: PadR family transcriptional regulator [Sphaerochaetaceae bacterium]|jgi:DNA-binding PadR family transcriptional regulator|nr:PadR family transcriptional regulator [Sphaerochaetaceae bacterium]MDX9808683.1 PadR family transcriptional regulator [Sphaerochaetaceae bacterium]NLV85313.1 helix-turn-helix transcriptional regulator [Spirochaetales bacterium]
METIQAIVDNLLLELRRGTLVLSVLSQLQTPRYGYSLVEHLKEKDVEIEPGTLYPLLRRLEKQGLLQSEWEISGSKPRKYYVLSDRGLQVLALLRIQWFEMKETIDALMREGDTDYGR